MKIKKYYAVRCLYGNCIRAISYNGVPEGPMFWYKLHTLDNMLENDVLFIRIMNKWI